MWPTSHTCNEGSHGSYQLHLLLHLQRKHFFSATPTAKAAQSSVGLPPSTAVLQHDRTLSSKCGPGSMSCVLRLNEDMLTLKASASKRIGSCKNNLSDTAIYESTWATGVDSLAGVAAHLLQSASGVLPHAQFLIDSLQVQCRPSYAQLVSYPTGMDAPKPYALHETHVKVIGRFLQCALMVCCKKTKLAWTLGSCCHRQRYASWNPGISHHHVVLAAPHIDIMAYFMC